MGNTFPIFSVTKIELKSQEVKIILFLEVSFDEAFFKLKIKLKQIFLVTLHPRSNKASMFISTTLKYRRYS